MPPMHIDVFRQLRLGSKSVTELTKEYAHSVNNAAVFKSVWSFGDSDKDELLTSIQSRHISLAEYTKGQICMGVKSGLTEAFVISALQHDNILAENPEADEIIKPFVNGRDVRKYFIEDKHQYLIYTFHGVDIRRYPSVKKHLEPYKAKLMNRATKQAWYELQQPQLKFAPLMDGVKIIFPDIAVAPRFAIDTAGLYGSNTTYFIPRNDPYLLGLLNSHFGFFYFRQVCAGLEGTGETYLRFFGQYLEGFPVKVVDEKNINEKTNHDLIVRSVEQIMAAKEQLASAVSESESEFWTSKCNMLERTIDDAVYKLYNLTPEEIALVEGTGS